MQSAFVRRVTRVFCGATLPAVARAAVLVATASLALTAPRNVGTLDAQGQTAPESTARIWIGRAAAIEACLRTAPIVRTETTARGVTKPVRAFLESGGPVGSMTWKALPPGRSNGFYEINRLLREKGAKQVYVR